MKLLLSLFSGIDLLGIAFQRCGFTVVSAGDIAFGRDIREFHAPAGHFAGVILGSPCQDFSCARRNHPPTGEGKAMIKEGARVILEAQPDWWLWENVPSVPTIKIAGYTHQRFDLTHRECGGEMLRRRHFQFGVKIAGAFGAYDGDPETGWWASPGSKLVINQSQNVNHKFTYAPVGESSQKIPWRKLCDLFDLPQDFDLKGLSRRGKYLAIRNGVPLKMGTTIATAIKNLMEGKQTAVKTCICGCGRPIKSLYQANAGPACRKRMERWRKNKEQETLNFP